jgi:hypothetical protein
MKPHDVRHPPAQVRSRPRPVRQRPAHQAQGRLPASGRRLLWQRRSRGRLGLAPRPAEGDGLQRHPHEPSPVRPGILRPVRSTRFYVFDEAFDEWTRDWPYNYTENTRGKSKYGYHLYFNQWHETDLRAMLRRDRNHPSVVLYSIGNEIPNQLDHDGWKMAKGTRRHLPRGRPHPSGHLRVRPVLLLLAQRLHG